ncbi:MAG: hypothetical protein ABIN35_01000 [candidate division WOR-3 bacterium]
MDFNWQIVLIFSLVLFLLLCIAIKGFDHRIEQFTPNVYQGHGIPLLHEQYYSLPLYGPSKVEFANLECRPSCCQGSSMSCSHGCVCFNSSK